MRRRTELRCSRGDDGFTLVELILAIIIIGVITVPLGNVVIGFLRNADATTSRLLESHDVQIASAYWAQDVGSLGKRSTTSPYLLDQSVWAGVSTLYSCSTSGTAIVSLAWDEYNGPGPATIVQVVYVKQTVSGQTQLHRLRCNGSATVVSDVIIAHDLDPDPLKPPTVACSTDCNAPPVPETLTLTLSLKNSLSRDSAFDVTLTGQRRQSS